uniref:Sodium/potassium/calcium exchanger n=1 Tax=Solanum tuberosum TaxID=4113 RepID=M1CMT3_SOLTU
MEIMLNNTVLTCASTLLPSTQDGVPLLAIGTKVKGDQNTNDEQTKVVDADEEGGDGDDKDENGNEGFEEGEEEYSDEGVKTQINSSPPPILFGRILNQLTPSWAITFAFHNSQGKYKVVA